jgi:membrane protein DedA with SNARE-associated domain
VSWFEEFLKTWSYLGVFLGILSTGVGMPIPEELPIVVGGVLVGHGSANFWMLPVCIVGVVMGDGLLYGIGYLWGPRLLTYKLIRTRVLPPERLASIEENFQKHGIKILLFARLTPGIRAPIFLTAGLIRLSLTRFLVADGIYAIPGVTLLFFLGYWFTDSMVDMIQNQYANVKSIIIIVVVVGVVAYFTYKFLRKPVVTGDPKEIPPLVEKVTHTIGEVTHKFENVTTMIMHPKGKESGPDPPPAGEHPPATNATPANDGKMPGTPAPAPPVQEPRSSER